MPNPSDAQLLRDYAAHGSEHAFGEIVARYTGLIYFAALRQCDSPELAREITQGVFTDLARKAPALAGELALEASLAGWLYRGTRYAALTQRRDERRRQERERLVMEHLNPAADAAAHPAHDPAADWDRVAPVLDEAMAELNDTDREAVLLRFFQNQDFHAVGLALGVSDDAAQKRVSRAVERLREFLAKRGVTVGASGLVVVISTNAVLMAPTGLSAAITVAAVAGTTIVTTAIATATKAIAMTTLQKTLIVAALAAAIGTGIYGTRQASAMRTQVQTLLQQQAAVADQNAQLTRERDTAASQLAALRNANPDPDRNTAELLRLRAEVTRLKTDAQAKAGNTNDQTLSEAMGWKNRVSQLKQYLEQFPTAKIPELQFVTEADWLNAAKNKLITERDYRQALSFLRGYGEIKFEFMLQKALAGYMKASNEQFPTDLRQLQPYFDSPVDEAVLQRWQIVPSTTVQNYGLGGDMVITQKAPVDDVFDTRRAIGSRSSTSMGYLNVETATLLNPVRQAFSAANNGRSPNNSSQLLPYATTAEQQAAIQKYILRDSPPSK